MQAGHVLVTGATGLVGGAVLERLLRADDALRAHVIVRHPARWRAVATRLGRLARRVTVHVGDLTMPELALGRRSRAAIRSSTSLVVHCAADTRFSQTLSRARRQNRDGTRHLLELAQECAGLGRFVYVSTAYVAGRATGIIPAAPLSGAAGWVNAYEQSKHEAERCVRGSGVPWLIVRPSTIVCDGVDGRVRQVNAVHRALMLCRAGLASLVPGDESTPVDLVTTDYVAGSIVRLALAAAGAAGATAATAATPASAGAAAGTTWHLCAGAGALPLGELLDRSWAHWRRDARWERRSVPRPALTSLRTYRLFETAVEETGDGRLRAITRSLTHFVPQLGLPKLFDTEAADALLGPAPAVRGYWTAMLDGLASGRRAVWAAA